MTGATIRMNKKNYVWLIVALVVVALAVYLLVSWPKMDSGSDAALPSNQPAASETATNTGSPVPPGTTPIPNPATDPDYSKETVIKVDGKTFTPVSIEAKAGTKAFLTFSALDDERHTFGFTDPSLDFILVVFNKAEGNKSITFPAPMAGTYTFYIDSQDNTGTLVVK